MKRYYFDLRTADGLAVDSEGYEYPDFSAARWGAVLALVDLSREINLRDDLAIDVRDDTGPVMQVNFKYHHQRRVN